jgi:hypothetical protein
MQYARLLFFILTNIDFLCCRLLCEIMLPLPNVLCRTYQDFHSIMKDIGMEYQAIHACPDDHILYYGECASKEEFLKFQISTYRTDKVTKKDPRKVLHYIPIIPHLRGLFK